MKIQQFNGGLSTRLKPQFLALNEATEYLNINNSVGSLTPVKNKVATDIPALQYNWYSNALNKWFNSNIYSTYTEYNNLVFKTDGLNPTVTDSSSTYSMGITAPADTPLTAIIQSTVVTDATLASATSGSATALPNQDTTYIFINDSSGVYSLSTEISITASAVPKTSTSLKGRFATADNPTVALASRAAGRILTAAADTSKRIITISNARTKVFGSNGVKVFRQYKDVWRRVGVLANDTSTISDSVEDISANEELDLTKYSPLQGVYQYVVTYYDNNKGRESGPSNVTEEVDLSDSGIVTLNSIPVSSDLTVTHKRIYRVGGNITSFALVAQIPNTQTVFNDAIEDLDIPGDLLTTQTYLPAPKDIKYICTANAMMFAAQGTKVRYTPIDQPESWPELYFITFDSEVTSIAVVYTGILVCTIAKTYIITGSGPNSLAVAPISTDQGCLTHKSMQILKGSALWASFEGICTSAGDTVQVISRNKLGKLTLDPIDSILVNEAYYVLNSDGVSYCLDTAIGPTWKKFDFGITSFAKKDSFLYGCLDFVLYQLEASVNNSTMVYKSPRFIEGSFTQAKLYKQVYIYSKGDIIVKIFIDDVLVAIESLSTEDNHTVYAPQESLRGYSIQFEIQGTGEVFEIEYVAGNANG